MKKENNKNLNIAIKELKDIADWFENQEEIDIELGLQKVKDGAKLVKLCKNRIKEIENSFEEVKKELDIE